MERTERQRSAERRAERRANGICITCKNPAAVKPDGGLAARCEACKARRRLNTGGPRRSPRPRRRPAPAGHKVCSKCGVSKPLGEYPVDKQRADGHRGMCRPCMLAVDRARRVAV